MRSPMLCKDCQALILDHLYELLDAPEAAAVDAHLRECPACAAAREETAWVKGMLATAARGSFPTVRFEPSVAKPKAPAPAVLAFPAPNPGRKAKPSRAARAFPWAVAAAVLLA